LIAGMLRMVTMNQFLSQDQNARFQASQQRAQLNGSVESLYDLALTSVMSKQYAETLGAATRTFEQWAKACTMSNKLAQLQRSN